MKHRQGKIAYIIILLNFIFFTTLANKPDDKKISTDSTENCLIEDDPVIKMLDSLSFCTFFNNLHFYNDTSNFSRKYPSNFVPTFSDSIYYERIKELNKTSPFNFYYNADVKKYIDVYAFKKRNLTSRVLGLAKLYFPIMESMMDKYNIPLEIKYLAIVESALNCTAISPARAGGIWQFIPGTGRMYQLNTNPLVDDRFDIYKATDAACRHMRDLYKLYNNWELVLAAYNSGAGNVNRAIQRSGGKRDFLSIKRFLPGETQGYVPAFIAVTYVMNYAIEHNIFPVAPTFFSYELDTVSVKKELSFQQISEMLKIPYDYITFLNPAYRKGFIPVKDKNYYKLRLPKDYIPAFINNEELLYAYKPLKPNKFELASIKKTHSKGGFKNGYHTVRKGETLSRIANKYSISLSELKSWNKIKNKIIRPGQKLLVLNPKEYSYNN